MPIDPRIILGMQQVQLPNPLQIQGQAEELRAARQRNKLADLAFAEKEREAAQERTMADLYKGATNPDGTLNRGKLLTGAASSGLGARIPAMQKGFAEQDKVQREAEKEKLAAARDQIGLLGQVVGSARDQASYSQGIAALQRAGIDVSQIPPQYDPAYVEQSRQQVLSAADQIDQVWKAKKFDLDVQQFGETKRHNSQQESLTARGQNMADARAREANRNAKAPAGYQWAADGKLAAIPGGPADKAATVSEGERNAAGFAERMAEAEKIIGEVAGKDASAQKPGFIEQMAGNGMIGNASRSDTRQQYRQAQEDWVRSKLRKESGAAIGADEMEREISMYFPQIGDKPEVIKQKAKARSTAIEAMRKSSGRAATSEPKAAPKDAPASPKANAGPRVGVVEDGYRFKGGDPSNPANWEKQ